MAPPSFWFIRYGDHALRLEREKQSKFASDVAARHASLESFGVIVHLKCIIAPIRPDPPVPPAIFIQISTGVTSRAEYRPHWTRDPDISRAASEA